MRQSTPRKVVRTYLELERIPELRAREDPNPHAELRAEMDITPDRYLRMYRAVGERWHWRDRLAWSHQQLTDRLARPDVHIWVLDIDGRFAGFFELEQLTAAVVEISYFGLAEPFIGRGLGGWLLTRAVEEAFALAAKRIVVNTCTLDAPHALPNYRARGFITVREERYTIDDDQPL